MITVHVRKQGGAAIMTIPADVLKMLHINIGATLELDVTKKASQLDLLLIPPISAIPYLNFCMAQRLAK